MSLLSNSKIVPSKFCDLQVNNVNNALNLLVTTSASIKGIDSPTLSSTDPSPPYNWESYKLGASLHLHKP